MHHAFMSGGRAVIRALLGAALCLPVAALAQRDVEVASCTAAGVPHVTSPLIIDGVLDDDAWNEALVLELDTETHPRENLPATVMTQAYLLEDGSRFVIGFDAMDPNPEEIRAYLRDRDSAYSDDFVGVVLDTFNDDRRAFQFFANALGVQMDMTNDDVNKREDDSWDAIWDSAGAINDEGYAVEMAIPFSQLRFPNQAGPQTWGIDVVRIHPREDRVRIGINALDRGRNCYLCQLAEVCGFAGAEPGRALEIVPSLTASRTDERNDPGVDPLVAGDPNADLGLNVRWGITPDITANLALNPDFSQIEADVPQLAVNNRFALFFPESRPFFLEGADFFSTPTNVVFTRTVSDPDIGAKLTGRRGDDSFGLFAADDAKTTLLFPGSLESDNDSLRQSNQVLVGRYNWGFGTASTIGGLVTNRSGAGYSNTVAGIDGRYRVNDRHNILFQYLRSETEYPAETAEEFEQPLGVFDGDAARMSYNFTAREWFANVDYQSFDPGFRADSGFISQVDIERASAHVQRIWHGTEENWWNQIRVGGNTGQIDDHGGRLLNRWASTFFNVGGPLQSFMNLNVQKGKQFWDGQLYDVSNVFLNGGFRPTGNLYFRLFVRTGDQIDFRNSRLGEQLRIVPFMEWNLNRHALLSLQHTSSVLDTQSGEEIFDAQLTDLRFTWQFNVRSFLRLTVQRREVERNLSLFDDQDTDAHSLDIGSQLLYSYKLNPQTVFFFGYSDNHLEDDDVLDLTQKDRTVFLKLSYAWMP